MSTREKPPLEGPLGQYLNAGFGEQEAERAWAKVRARRALAEHKPSNVVLPSPIGPALLEEDALAKSRARMWREVRARVHRPERPRGLRVALGGAAVLGALAAWVFVFLSWRTPGPVARRETPAALLVADGQPLSLLETDEKPLTVRLADDSEIRLAAGSRVEPLSSSGSRFELLLARGSAEFSVTPGGPRRWLIEAGAARVEVVGTVFRVTRSGASVRVSVSRGTVLVRGENVPGWVQRVTAGEQLTVAGKERASSAPHAPAAKSAVSGASASAAPVADQAQAEAHATATRETPSLHAAATQEPHAPARDTPRSARRVHSPSESALPARELSPAERYAALGANGVSKATLSATSIEELLELADIARLSGHPQDAVAPLERALDIFRSSRQAALAAFTLGRVLLDQLHSSEHAAEAFERALVLGLPRGLRADCYRRLAEAYERSSNYVESIRAEQRAREEAKREAGATKPEVTP